MKIPKFLNIFFPVNPPYDKSFSDIASTPKQYKKDLSRVISPVQFQRFRHDIQMWREAVSEAEQGFVQMRHRVRMQRMYLDTALNEHITACILERKRLTFMREYAIIDDGDVVDDNATNFFKNKMWFYQFLSYVIDSIFYGYTLISLGDVINSGFPDISFVKRENVSPDRQNVTTFVYSMSGTPFLEAPQSNWHIWVPTSSDNGHSNCGYGLFYPIAKTEIFLRNNFAYNLDFNEMYGLPIRKGKTSKQNDERDEFFNALLQMAHNAVILLDDGMDELELLESKSTGTGWQAFENFETRAEAKITKILLGHADAMTSVPGKLGNTQKRGEEETPVQKALDAIQTEDGRLCETIINSELIPRMRKFGFNIPVGKKFKFLNNKEKKQVREDEDKSNQATANIALSMFQAGLKMDPIYFEQRTGIKTIEITQSSLPDSIKNKLNQIYNKRERI